MKPSRSRESRGRILPFVCPGRMNGACVAQAFLIQPGIQCDGVSYTVLYRSRHASCTRLTVYMVYIIRNIEFTGLIYVIFIEYSIRLYRICRPWKTVDNSEKSDAPRRKLWITVWTVWKCMRLCTVFFRHEYARMDSSRVKNVEEQGDCAVCRRKRFMQSAPAPAHRKGR